MPCCDDEEHSASEFYCHGETNDPNATFQGENNNAEQNNSCKYYFYNTLMASFCMVSAKIKLIYDALRDRDDVPYM